MPRRRAPYLPEFRQQMVELVRAGRTPEALSREFEPTAEAIRKLVCPADRDEGRRHDVPGAGCLHQWVLCVAEPRAVSQGCG